MKRLFAAVHESGFDAVDGSSAGTRVPKMWALLVAPTIRRSSPMQTVSTIGLDIAKSVFQVHGVDANGQVVIRRQLKRRYVLAFFEKLAPCLIGIEACLCCDAQNPAVYHPMW
jgi:hypothetical protein